MSLVTYTPAGPWSNNNPPGISASVLTAMEAFMSAIAWDTNASWDGSGNLTLNSIIATFNKINPSPSTISGATSGTASLYQPWQGIVKLVLVSLNGFRNGSGSPQLISLPTAFTVGCYWWTSNVNTFSLTSGGTAQSCNVVTALGGGTGGSTTAETSLGSQNNGDCPHAFDAVSFSGGAASSHTGFIVLFGI